MMKFKLLLLPLVCLCFASCDKEDTPQIPEPEINELMIKNCENGTKDYFFYLSYDKWLTKNNFKYDKEDCELIAPKAPLSTTRLFPQRIHFRDGNILASVNDRVINRMSVLPRVWDSLRLQTDIEGSLYIKTPFNFDSDKNTLKCYGHKYVVKKFTENELELIEVFGENTFHLYYYKKYALPYKNLTNMKLYNIIESEKDACYFILDNYEKNFGDIFYHEGVVGEPLVPVKISYLRNIVEEEFEKEIW